MRLFNILLEGMLIIFLSIVVLTNTSHLFETGMIVFIITGLVMVAGLWCFMILVEKIRDRVLSWLTLRIERFL